MGNKDPISAFVFEALSAATVVQWAGVWRSV